MGCSWRAGAVPTERSTVETASSLLHRRMIDGLTYRAFPRGPTRTIAGPCKSHCAGPPLTMPCSPTSSFPPLRGPRARGRCPRDFDAATRPTGDPCVLTGRRGAGLSPRRPRGLGRGGVPPGRRCRPGASPGPADQPGNHLQRERHGGSAVQHAPDRWERPGPGKTAPACGTHPSRSRGWSGGKPPFMSSTAIAVKKTRRQVVQPGAQMPGQFLGDLQLGKVALTPASST